MARVVGVQWAIFTGGVVMLAYPVGVLEVPGDSGV